MNNIHRVALPVVATALAIAFVAAPVLAGKQTNPEHMTCEEFLELGEEVQPAVVYWLHGKSGKIDAIDIEEYHTPVAYVVAECTKEKQATVWEKVTGYVAQHVKPTDMDAIERNSTR